MNILKIVIPCILISLFYTLNAHAANTSVQAAIESESLKISLDENTGTGVVYGKVCDECEELKLNITPETRAYEGKTQVGLAQARGRLGREATVIFNTETKNVVSIRW